MAQLASTVNDEGLVIDALCALLSQEEAKRQLLPDLLSQCAIQLAATLRDPRHAESVRAHAEELQEIKRLWPVVHAVDFPGPADRKAAGNAQPRPPVSSTSSQASVKPVTPKTQGLDKCVSGIATAQLPTAALPAGERVPGLHSNPGVGVLSGEWHAEGDTWRFSVHVSSISSLSEGILDISDNEIQLRRDSGDLLVRSTVPGGADMTKARAHWSKRSQQLSICAPRCKPCGIASSGSFCLDGRWMSESGVFVADIRGAQLSWADGSGVELELLGEGRAAFRSEGKRFTAMLDPPGRLSWSDGDVWVRRGGDLSGPPVDPSPVPLTTPRAPAAAAAAAAPTVNPTSQHVLDGANRQHSASVDEMD